MPNIESESSLDQETETIVLNKEVCLALLRTARQAIETTVAVTEEDVVDLQETLDDQMQQPAAVFVTLWQKAESGDSKRLRGCIGRLQPDFPLYQAVKNAAVSAATRDPRFPPVQSNELDSLTIEIAVLSPMEKVNTLEEVVIGRDGLVIEAMNRRGLLLPKVASRLGWNREEFLQNVCYKAGLAEDIWPDSGQLSRFSTTVFHE